MANGIIHYIREKLLRLFCNASYVWKKLGCGEAPTSPKSDRDCRVQMAARDVADGISHGENSQPESKGDAM